MKKSTANEKKKIEFTYKADPGREVFIAGTFNDWDPSKTRLTESDAGVYRISIKLPAGRHEYKFVIDGCWQIDPENPGSLLNDFGGLNSVITVN
jgi:1,4-alpha-glucan branching enzyme